jgi:hypothetical protein
MSNSKYLTSILLYWCYIVYQPDEMKVKHVELLYSNISEGASPLTMMLINFHIKSFKNIHGTPLASHQRTYHWRPNNYPLHPLAFTVSYKPTRFDKNKLTIATNRRSWKDCPFEHEFHGSRDWHIPHIRGQPPN